MGILQMSAAGAALVAVTALLRALLGRRAPRGAFVALWWIALARFLLPVSLPFRLSAYMLLPRAAERAAPGGAGGGLPFSEPAVLSTAAAPDGAIRTAFPLWQTVWLAGFTLCAVVFVAAYWRSRRMLRDAASVRGEAFADWMRAHPLRRPLRLLETPCLDAPMTCGVLRPVIYLPLGMDGAPELRYALEHEWIHVRRFDALCKLLLAFTACVHWFNPLAWLLLVLANRDLELSCDYQVVSRLGGGAEYARTLLRMEARRSGWLPLGSHFSRNAMEERIVSIMKWKHAGKAAGLGAAALVIAVTAAFATSPAHRPAPQSEPVPMNAGAADAQIEAPQDSPKARALAQIEALFGGDASQLACTEETSEGGTELTFGDPAQDAWYYKAGTQAGEMPFTFVGRYHGRQTPAVSGPLEDSAFRADDPAIREACRAVLREAVGVEANITRERVYASAAADVLYADMVGVEFMLEDGRYCTVTLQYPALTPRSYQLLSVSYLDANAKRGDSVTQVLFDTAA